MNAQDADREHPAAGRVRGKAGYHHGGLHEALLDAARILLVERGPQGFTMAEAARLASVSTAAPYRHYDSKEALLRAVADRGFGELRAALDGILRASHSWIPAPSPPVSRCAPGGTGARRGGGGG